MIHYVNQCWSSLLTQKYVTRSQWVNDHMLEPLNTFSWLKLKPEATAWGSLFLHTSLLLPLLICHLKSWRWCHNERDGVSNHRVLHCLLNRLFSHRKHQSSASLAFVRGIELELELISTGDQWIPTQRASDAGNVSVWWRHHVQLMQWMIYLCKKPVIYPKPQSCWRVVFLNLPLAHLFS